MWIRRLEARNNDSLIAARQISYLVIALDVPSSERFS